MQNYNKNLFDKYNNYFYNYNFPNIYYKTDIYMNEVPVNTDVGYIELYVFTERGLTPVEGAEITFYVRRGDEDRVKVKEIISEINPIIVELPIAHPSGTLIRGPEYYFTTYDMVIEKEGYYGINALNIRMFPGITAQFNYNLNRALPNVPGRQETFSIPSHPRDIIVDQLYKKV